ncbi:MAG: hypothetical protein K6C13_02155 [Oscillospiraceae bacterium]|nr:hypothetical protein [Oscillospiraceae bacterium]
MKKIIKFSDAQADLLRSLGLPTTLSEDNSDEEIIGFTDIVSEHLQMYGLTDDGENDIGEMCADILTAIAVL